MIFAFYFSWTSMLLWLQADDRITRSDIWAVQIATIVTFIVERGFAFWREGRQHRWDVDARKATNAKVEEVKTEVVETHRQLNDGVKTGLKNVLERFDTIADEVAAKPTMLKEDEVNRVADAVAIKVANGLNH